MRNIILIVSMMVMVFAFSGCGKIGPKFTTESGIEYYINNEGNGEYAYFSTNDTNDVFAKGGNVHNETVKRKNLKLQLTAAAKYTKKLGYKYFAVTNVNISNLSGFPINNYNDLARYITLAERKENFATNGSARDMDGLINNGRVPEMYLRFMPISNSVANSGAISVWKVSDFVR